MNGIETRKAALALAKNAKAAIKASDWEKVLELQAEADELYSYASKMENFHKYEDTTEVAEDENYPPDWCFERARESTYRSLIALGDSYDEYEEAARDQRIDKLAEIKARILRMIARKTK